MKRTHEIGMHIVIGDEFSQPMSYQDSVGASGIITHAMSAVCEVFILTGKDTGKTLDIHVKDCLAQEDKEISYSGIIHAQGRKVYYSNDIELIRYTKKMLSGSINSFHNVTDLDSILEQARQAYRTTGWTMHSLDNVNEQETAHFRASYLRKLSSEKKIEKATKLVGDSFKYSESEDDE